MSTLQFFMQFLASNSIFLLRDREKDPTGEFVPFVFARCYNLLHLVNFRVQLSRTPCVFGIDAAGAYVTALP